MGTDGALLTLCQDYESHAAGLDLRTDLGIAPGSHQERRLLYGRSRSHGDRDRRGLARCHDLPPRGSSAGRHDRSPRRALMRVSAGCLLSGGGSDVAVAAAGGRHEHRDTAYP